MRVSFRTVRKYPTSDNDPRNNSVRKQKRHSMWSNLESSELSTNVNNVIKMGDHERLKSIASMFTNCETPLYFWNNHNQISLHISVETNTN